MANLQSSSGYFNKEMLAILKKGEKKTTKTNTKKTTKTNAKKTK